MTDAAAVSPEEQGRAEAEAFDRRLREAEAREREERIGGVGHVGTVRPTDYGPPLVVARLTSRLEELTAFRTAVQRSLVWRTAQRLRRLVGRAW